MKIFYSWQSDTPPNVGREFIKEAVAAAIEELNAEIEVEDAERLELDQDTKGVLGSPSIAETIFAKIREASIVVVDVTLTGSTPSGKRAINSNVAYELGYAHGVHGDTVLLKVMNDHFGPPEHLPFDLRHRRWPVRFDLPPETSKSEQTDARGKLTSKLKPILAMYMEELSKPLGEVGVFQRTPSTSAPSRYWQDGEPLFEGDPNHNVPVMACPPMPLAFLRIWPTTEITAPSAVTFKSPEVHGVSPLGGYGPNGMGGRNKFGWINFGITHGSSLIERATQVLRSGEIWGFNANWVRDRAEEDLGPTEPYIPMVALEQAFAKSLRGYLKLGWEKLGYPDRVMVEGGVTGVAGYRIPAGSSPVHGWFGPIFDDVVVKLGEVSRSDETSTDLVLRKIFNTVFEAAGEVRPDG